MCPMVRGVSIRSLPARISILTAGDCRNRSDICSYQPFQKGSVSNRLVRHNKIWLLSTNWSGMEMRAEARLCSRWLSTLQKRGFLLRPPVDGVFVVVELLGSALQHAQHRWQCLQSSSLHDIHDNQPLDPLSHRRIARNVHRYSSAHTAQTDKKTVPVSEENDGDISILGSVGEDVIQQHDRFLR